MPPRRSCFRAQARQTGGSGSRFNATTAFLLQALPEPDS